MGSAHSKYYTKSSQNIPDIKRDSKITQELQSLEKIEPLKLNELAKERQNQNLKK